MQRLEEYEDRESWLFLNLDPSIIFKLDLIWIFSFDLQLVGVLIVEYTYQMTEFEIVISCSHLSLLSGSSWIIRFEFGRKSYDSNTKMYLVRIRVKIASSHPLIFSLSIYPFGFGLCIWCYPRLIFRFNHLIHQKLNLTNWIWDHPPVTK